MVPGYGSGSMNDTEWPLTRPLLEFLQELHLEDKPNPPEPPMTKEDLDAARDALVERAEEIKRTEKFPFPGKPYKGKTQNLESQELPLQTIGELLNQPEEDTRWVWDRMLPTHGLSLLVAPPKAGKTTLVRCLSLAVARGYEFLGRETQKAPVVSVPCRPPGPIILLALEDKAAEIRRRFRDLGATEDDPIRIFADPAPKDILAQLGNVIDRLKPTLVVIDPVYKCIRVTDANDYVQVSEGLEVVVNMARGSGAHILVVHHARKGGGGHGEEALGSTALFGAVDCALFLKRDESKRMIYSINRYGEDMPESVLTMDETGWVSLAGTKAEIDRNDTSAEILALLNGQPMEQQAILESVTGTGKVVRAALNSLVDGGSIERTGAGRKNNPYRYSRF